MINFLPLNEKTDVEKLLIFVNSVKELLFQIVYNDIPGVKRRRLVINSLQSFMESAWNDVHPHFSNLTDKINLLDNSKLQRHGLEGTQLTYKLAIVNYRWKKFKKSGTAKLLKKLLFAIDTLLDSIVDATGVGGAIKEFKESIINSTLES